MAYSIKLAQRYLKTDPPLEAPIFIRVIYNRKYFYALVKKAIKVVDWDESKEKVRKSNQNSVKLNAYMHRIKNEVDSSMMDLMGKFKLIPNELIIDAVKRKKKPNDFMSFFQAHLDEIGRTERIGTFKKDRVVFHKLKEMLGTRRLDFHDINHEFLATFEQFLRDKYSNNQNTIHNNLRVLRKLFNKAIREGIDVTNEDTFRSYKLKKGRRKEIVYLTEDELDRLWSLDLAANNKDKIHRDMFVFACETGGLRIADILLLKWQNIQNGRVIINSQKTDTPTSIKMTHRALKIINAYRINGNHPSHFVFPVLNNTVDYDTRIFFNERSSQTVLINKTLDKIRLRAQIRKHISFHVSRHTFAMRALNKGVDLVTISRLMGHSTTSMTEKYMKIMNPDLDRAMEKMDVKN